MRRLFLVVIWIITISYNVLGQMDNGYHVKEYTTDNGLPSNGIRGLQWDETNGFLWIATEAGLSRFNGIDFTNFNKETTTSLSHERMAFLVQNDSGEIYVADISGNFCKIHLNNIEQYLYPGQALPFNFNSSFYFAATGTTLRKKIASLIQSSGNTPWYRMAQLRDGRAIILAEGTSYYATSSSLNDFVPLELPRSLLFHFSIGDRLFFSDPAREINVANQDLTGFEKIRIVTQDNEQIDLNPSEALIVWENGMKNPILFIREKAWLLHDKGQYIEAELICTAIPSSSFIRFAQYSEKSKILFIGTDSKGITVIKKNRVLSVKKENTNIRERNAYYSQVELPGQQILTGEGHIIGLPGDQKAPLPIKGKFSYSIYNTSDSVIWYGQVDTISGVLCLHNYNYKTSQTTVYNKIEVASNFGLTSSTDGIYVATKSGLGKIDTDSLRYLFKLNEERRFDANPLMMIEYSPGVFIAAGCNGLIRYDTKTQKKDVLLNLQGYCIRSLWKFRDYLFIGTYGKGYFIFKDGVMKAMPLDKNNFLSYTHCFVPDEEGFCWMSTNRGLLKAWLPDIINAFEKDNQRVYYHYFGKNDGMEITEMNGGCAPCALVMKDKTISFPTMDGLLWVKSDPGATLLPEGNIYLDEFRAGTQKINVDSLTTISLSPRENDIMIKLGFSAWSNKENIYLDYRLNNDRVWKEIDINNGAFIQLINLPPGSYKLLIRKQNGFGVDNYSYKEIKFNIRTPWHKQGWFSFLIALGMVVLVGFYLRFRTRQYKIRQRKLETQVTEKTRELQEQNEILEKNNSIKTRLISIISHDIITPLKFLTVAGKNLMEKKKLMNEQLRDETIREMTNTSQELQLLSTNILNWIKYQNENRRLVKENFNVSEMVDQVLGLLQSLARQKNLSIENKIDRELKIQQFYEPLKILVYNLLTNAIHFTERGIITVYSTLNEDSVAISVKDEGIGMTPEQVQRLLADQVVITSINVDNKKGHGLGYLIIKDLVKAMGAYITIESKKGMGTTVSVVMPTAT